MLSRPTFSTVYLGPIIYLFNFLVISQYQQWRVLFIGFGILETLAINILHTKMQAYVYRYKID